MKLTQVIQMAWLAVLLALAPSGALAERASDLTVVPAPPLFNLKPEMVDLGTWDDAFAFADEDAFVLRRGEDFYLLPPSGEPKPARACTVPGAGNLKAISGAVFGERLWLFCQPVTGTSGAPCAIDVRTGRKVTFGIPGMAASEIVGPDIQSWTILPHTGGAIFMVSGGGVKIWPREGNRPLYYWFNLGSGAIRQMPVGWDLFYFSADQATAIFDTLETGPDGYRKRQAVSMASGLDTADGPERDKVHFIHYSWNNTNRIQTVKTPRKPGEGDTFSLAGLSFDGAWYPIKLPGDVNSVMGASLEERDGRLVLRAGPPGSRPVESIPGWTCLLGKDDSFLALDGKTRDCALTGAHTGVFTAYGYGSKGKSTEAFAFDAKTKRAWNLLDGIERLPALSPEDAAKDYTQDGMGVELVRGTGSRMRPGLALCVFWHGQGDLRAVIPDPDEKRIPFRQWHHAVLVAPGKRYETGLFQHGLRPQFLWLLNSWKIVYGGSETHDGTPGTARAMRLYLADLGAGAGP